MISSPRTLSIFTTIKVFIHYHIHSFHSLHHLTRARARGGGGGTHTEECETHTSRRIEAPVRAAAIGGSAVVESN